MKAKSFAHHNKPRKKPAHKKQFLGTDVRTVSQLRELKCSPRRKLHIANQILAYTENLLLTQDAVDPLPKPQLDTLKVIVSDWKSATKKLKAELREKNIERSKVHTPFANLLQ